MKAKTRILLLLMGLTLPYMVFVLIFALRLQEQSFPRWFVYGAACYFFGSILLFPFLRKKVLAGAPALTVEEQKVQRSSGVRAARRMGYVWWIGPIFYVLSGELTLEPWWASVLMFCWIGLLSWGSFRFARNLEAKAKQNAI